MIRPIALAFAMFSFWLSGAWWDEEPRASAYAGLFAFFMLLIAGFTP